VTEQPPPGHETPDSEIDPPPGEPPARDDDVIELPPPEEERPSPMIAPGRDGEPS
jgi:hypothetical protein